MRSTGIDCVFCGIVAGTQPADVVFRWDDAIAFLPRADDETGRRGCTRGHILVVPREHVADAAESPPITGFMARRAAELARGLYRTDFHLIANCGFFAGQSVEHLHWHIVPRCAGDGLRLPWTDD